MQVPATARYRGLCHANRCACLLDGRYSLERLPTCLSCGTLAALTDKAPPLRFRTTVAFRDECRRGELHVYNDGVLFEASRRC